MTQLTDEARQVPASQEDRVGLIIKILDQAEEPLSPAQIRRGLPAELPMGDAEIAAALRSPDLRGKVFEYPPARGDRGAGPRYSAQPPERLIESLLRRTLADEPLTAGQLQRKMGPFRAQVPEALHRLVAAGEIHAVPPTRGRRVRYSSRPPDPAEVLRPELGRVLQRLAARGFSPESLRRGIAMLVNDDAAFQHLMARPVDQPPAPAPAPGVEPAEPPRDEAADLERLVLEILPEIHPPAVDGPVPIPELWQAVELKFPDKAAFDDVLRRLADRGAIDLHPHDQPEAISPEQRAQMVEHPSGAVFARVQRRPPREG